MYQAEVPTSLRFTSSPYLDSQKYGRHTSSSYRTEQESQYSYLKGRQSVQIRMDILEAKCVPVKRIGSRVFVRMRAMKNCGNFEMNTEEVEISEQPQWNQSQWTFTFETSVEGVILELHMRKPCLMRGGFKKKSTILGEVHVPFNLLLASPTLSALDWLSFHKDDHI